MAHWNVAFGWLHRTPKSSASPEYPFRGAGLLMGWEEPTETAHELAGSVEKGMGRPGSAEAAVGKVLGGDLS